MHISPPVVHLNPQGYMWDNVVRKLSTTDKGTVVVSEHKVVSPKAKRAIMDDVCENCDEPYEIGTWVLQVNIGEYEYFIHEVCPVTTSTTTEVEV